MKAEEFIQQFFSDEFREKYEGKGGVVKNLMIEFAKLHVKAALKVASEEADVLDECRHSMQEGSCVDIDKDSILNSYPLTKIQ